MKNYIYIKNDGIQVVQIKGKNKITTQVPLTPGAILNGVILNAEQVKGAFSQITKKLSKVTLVVDSSNIITKKINIPTVSSDKLNEILKGEFDLYNKEENYLFDTNVVKRNSSEMTVLCYAVSQNFIDSYVNMFKELKISIARIEVAINGVIKYIGVQEELKYKTFLLNIITGDNMLSLLFENGEYKFANRSRLLNRETEPLLNQELYSRLSSMIQFNQSERSEHAIEKSYYIGLTEDELVSFNKFVADINNGVDAEMFSTGDFDLDYIYPCSAILQNKKDVDFTKNKQKQYTTSKRNKSILTKILVLLVVVFALFMSIGAMLIEKMEIEAANAELEDYLNSDYVVSQLEIYDDVSTQNTLISSEKNALTSLTDEVALSLLLEIDTLEEIFDGSISNLSYNLSSKTVSISGSATSESAVVKYVAELRELENFESLTYFGYNLNESDLSCTFSIEASLSLQESEDIND